MNHSPLKLLVVFATALAGCGGGSGSSSNDAGIAMDVTSCDAQWSLYDDQRKCASSTTFAIPVCLRGPSGGKELESMCAFAPNGSVYFASVGLNWTPSATQPGWTFRAANLAGGMRATDGSVLTDTQVADCDLVNGMMVPICSCNDLGC